MQNLFSRSPWEREAVVSLHRHSLGQASSPNCEPTPEGGLRCADGKYYPPGCAPASGAGIPAAPPTPGSMVPLLVAGAAAAAAGAYFLMAGHRHVMGDEAGAYPVNYPGSVPGGYTERSPGLSPTEAAFVDLGLIADKIHAERANDAYFFMKYIDASKRRQDLVFTEDAAQKALAAQERIWNTSHLNNDQYQAAQAAYEQAVIQKAAATQEMQENRDGINIAAQNIMTYRSNAEAVISQLPADDQDQARRIIDPCTFKKPSMEGAFFRPIPVINR